jgi:hypothetical protein
VTVENTGASWIAAVLVAIAACVGSVVARGVSLGRDVTVKVGKGVWVSVMLGVAVGPGVSVSVGVAVGASLGVRLGRTASVGSTGVTVDAGWQAAARSIAMSNEV